MPDQQMIRQPDSLAPPPALATIDRGFLAVADVTARVRRVQEIMRDLMIKDTHYGQIPGTPKPTLYQPGAELLCVTFRIAPSPRVEDLSTGDAIRYRVTMQATSQQTGEMLGEGIGECSSDEEKYRWRKPVCNEEWDETPADFRREKWQRGNSSQGNYKIKQVRTSPADIANTVLKMAYKRALISMTRTVLGCSDIFAQDLEDLSPEIREVVVDEHNGHAPAAAPMQAPQRRPAPAPVHTPAPVAAAPVHHPAPAAPPTRQPGDEPDDPFGDFDTPALDETDGPPVSDERRALEDEVRSGKFSAGGAVITEAQRKRLYAVARGKGWSNETYRAQIQRFGFNRDNDVTTVAYNAIVAFFEAHKGN